VTEEKPKPCEICGVGKHHCEICEQICQGSIEDKRNPQNCLTCGNRGYYGNPRGPVVICKVCPKGARLKLWVIHEKRLGNYVATELIA
jgi:hypothetical protein